MREYGELEGVVWNEESIILPYISVERESYIGNVAPETATKQDLSAGPESPFALEKTRWSTEVW